MNVNMNFDEEALEQHDREIRRDFARQACEEIVFNFNSNTAHIIGDGNPRERSLKGEGND